MKGRSGIGSHKHGVSGHTGKSPKFRHGLKREAEKNERKKKKSINMYSSVTEALKGEGK